MASTISCTFSASSSVAQLVRLAPRQLRHAVELALEREAGVLRPVAGHRRRAARGRRAGGARRATSRSRRTAPLLTLQHPDVVVVLAGRADAALERDGQAAGHQRRFDPALGRVVLGIVRRSPRDPQRPAEAAAEEEEMRDDLPGEAALGAAVEPAGGIDLPGARPVREGDLDLDAGRRADFALGDPVAGAGRRRGRRRRGS